MFNTSPRGSNKSGETSGVTLTKLKEKNLAGHTYNILDHGLFEPTYINQCVIDESIDFAVRVEDIKPDKTTLKDFSRERMMNHRVWDITPKNIY